MSEQRDGETNAESKGGKLGPPPPKRVSARKKLTREKKKSIVSSLEDKSTNERGLL